MRIGSLYAGVGGLCTAAEQALGGTIVWQLDLVNAAVRRRHWPDALQVEADVATVDPCDLPRIDVLSGSFACQDLSCAGKGDGLIDGSRTGPTYRHLLRFAGARLTDDGFERDDRRLWLPEVVVMENVPALLTRWQTHLEEDWRRLGYGLTWVRARALDAGHPHRRARVFVLAERGGPGRGVLDVPRDGAWTPEQRERKWATVCAANPNEGEDPASWEARRRRELAKGINGNGISEPLAQQIRLRPWPTVTARDYKTGELNSRVGSESLSNAISNYTKKRYRGRVSNRGISHGCPAYASEADSVRLLWGTGTAQAISRRILGEPLHVPSAEILQLAMHGARLAEGGAVSGRDQQAADAAEEAVVRGLLHRGSARDPSSGRRLAQQLAGELGDALRKLSRATSLAGGEDDADKVAAMPGVRQEKQGARIVREALPSVEDVGRSDNGEGQPAHAGAIGRRLNPAFCESLMGFPPGWTLPEGPRQEVDPNAPAVRGRYPADWDRSVYWPGYDWEPPRTLPDGPPCRGRPTQIRAIGNACSPQQGRMAIETALASPAQIRDDIPRREHMWIADDGSKVGEGQHRVAKVGKKAAGRLLDGRTWDAQ